MTVYHAVLAYAPPRSLAPRECGHLHVTLGLAMRCARRMSARYGEVYRPEVSA